MNRPLVTGSDSRPEQSIARTFQQRLQAFLHEIEMETALLQRNKPRGINIDTPAISLLRVAHYALAALLDLMEINRESRP